MCVWTARRTTIRLLSFRYLYHYGDSYIPYLQQEEPLNLACRHFIDCIETNSAPLTGGRQGLDMIRILEGASASLKMSGARFVFSTGNGSSSVAALSRNGSSHGGRARKRRKVPSPLRMVLRLWSTAHDYFAAKAGALFTKARASGQSLQMRLVDRDAHRN